MIRFRTLGTVDLRGLHGIEVRSVLAQPRRLALFAYLALARPRGFQRRDSLLAMFWPDSDQEHARTALRQGAHFLRQALGPDVLVNRGTEEMEINRDLLWCDAIEFEEALDRGEPLVALEAYTGELLRGFFADDAPEFERWLDAERARLRDRSTQAAWRLADRGVADGDTQVATRWARWAGAQEPDNEIGQRRLIALLLRLGDRRSAQKCYAEFATRLHRDFDAEPEPETQALIGEAPPPPPPRAASRASPLPIRAEAVPDATPVALPLPPRDQPEAIPRRPPWIAAILAAAAIVVAVFAARRAWIPQSGRGLPPAVAVFPIAVRGHPELAYLREGMIDLLSARIDGVGGLRVIDPNAVLGLTGDSANIDPGRGAAIARRLGAAYFVIGDAVEIAGRLQLSAALYAVERPAVPLARTASEGEATDVFRLANRVAAQLLVGTVPGVDTALTRLAGFTTPSPEAFRAYVTGEAALRGGHYQQAVNAFQQAVAQDSLFALAYYRLAVAADWTGYAAVEQSSAATAVRLGSRLSPLARNMLDGFLAYTLGEGDAAEQVYRETVALHPDNVEAQYMLGEVFFHYNPARGRPFTESRGQFERVLALDHDNPHALIHLARVAAAEEHHGELESLVHQFLALRPDADRALEMQALLAFGNRDSADQRTVTVQLRGAREIVVLEVQQVTAALTEDLVGAERLATIFETSEGRRSWKVLGMSTRSRLEAARGRWTRARTILDSMAVTAPDWSLSQSALLALTPFAPLPDTELRSLETRLEGWVLRSPDMDGHLGSGDSALRRLRPYLLGLLADKAGRPDAVIRLHSLADSLERMAGPNTVLGFRQMAVQAAHSLRARAERLRNRPDRALAELEQIEFGDHRLPLNLPEASGFERFFRAELLHSLGRDDEALQWYASFPSPSAFDIVFLAPAHLHQARILEHRGDRSEAAYHYRHFIALWSDCDSALVPTVDSARAALKRLSQPVASR